LDLRDVTLVGHSMGGGEIIRYLSRHGPDRVARIALVAASLPALCATVDKPKALDPLVYQAFINEIRSDHPRYRRLGTGVLRHPPRQPGLQRGHRRDAAAGWRTSPLAAPSPFPVLVPACEDFGSAAPAAGCGWPLLCADVDGLGHSAAYEEHTHQPDNGADDRQPGTLAQV
jgi:pimeloyl-ACP methyl ester carboxylesterase